MLSKMWGEIIYPFINFNGGANGLLLPHDCWNNPGDQLSHTSSLLPKPIGVNQVAMAAIVISNNTCRISTMHLCMDSVKLESPCIVTLRMASFINEGNPRLAKRPLKTNGRLANRGLTSLVKRPPGCFLWGCYYFVTICRLFWGASIR